MSASDPNESLRPSGRRQRLPESVKRTLLAELLRDRPLANAPAVQDAVDREARRFIQRLRAAPQRWRLTPKYRE